MSDIPIHNLFQPRRMLDIMRLPVENAPDAVADKIHRDDHYNFFLLENGTTEIMVDFQNLSLNAGAIFFIVPGQIHRRISHQNAQGWYLAPDNSLIPTDFRNIFESNFGILQPLFLNKSLFNQCISILNLINERNISADSHDTFQSKATVSLLHSFLGIVAGGHNGKKPDEPASSRPHQLSYEFRNLVFNNFKSLKSPSDYAARLNISANYLNEVIKRSTGFTVSYWIMYEIILEAKRLLIYTNLDAKEISYKLNYTDPAYFSNLFKKHTGQSPLSFRIKNSK